MSKTHGMKGTTIYHCWTAMRARCYNSNSPKYQYYGARGIKICKHWDKFENFYKDMGDIPSKHHSLDRWPNNNGNYEPNNCRWATSEQQANNRRSNKLVLYKDQKLTLAEALRLAGSRVGKVTASKRLKIGWTVEDAVETIPTPNGRY